MPPDSSSEKMEQSSTYEPLVSPGVNHVNGLVAPFNSRAQAEKVKKAKRPASMSRYPRPAKEKPPVDMERMYARPQPDPFTPQYEDGYSAGYDGESETKPGANWWAGYYDGQADRELHKQEMDRAGSSNS